MLPHIHLHTLSSTFFFVECPDRRVFILELDLVAAVFEADVVHELPLGAKFFAPRS